MTIEIEYKETIGKELVSPSERCADDIDIETTQSLNNLLPLKEKIMDKFLQYGILSVASEPNVIASYGMNAGYLWGRKHFHHWINSVTKVSHTARDEETWEEFKEYLNHSFIQDSKDQLAHSDLDDYMEEPILILDHRRYKFYAQKKYSTILLTWVMTNEPVDLDAMADTMRFKDIKRRWDEIRKEGRRWSGKSL